MLRPGTVLFIFLYFTPCLTFSLRLMVTHRLDSCDHLLYRLVTRYVPCLYCCRDSIVPCDLLSHVDGLWLMTLLFWWHHRSHADSLLFPVTYCTRDAIVLVTSIVLVTLLFSFTISNSCLWPYSLRLDFLYPTVQNNRVFPIHPLSDPFKVFLSYLKYSRVTTSHQ